MAVELFFGAVFAMYNGAMGGFPHRDHARSCAGRPAFRWHTVLATGIDFGGFTPAIATYLINATGDRAIPRRAGSPSRL